MRKLVIAMMVLTLAAVPAWAASLNVSVVSGGSNNVEVQPGATVDYEVRGVLSDTNNEGLALFGFDLSFDGGDLAQANNPTNAPMDNFANDLGINNPAGFGGTLINGDLIQAGGGQNTINNDIDNAPFPIGAVITGVAHSEVVLLTGSLTAPDAEGVYTLSLSNLFANVIKDGETGEIFWATEAASVGTITDLTITVSAVNLVLVSSSPAGESIDPRQPSDPNGANPAGIDVVNLTFNEDPSALGAGDFTITEQGGSGGVPAILAVNNLGGNTLELVFDSFFQLGAWTVITHNGSGTFVRIGVLPADVNNDGTSGVADVLAVIDSLTGAVPLPLEQTDIDRSGVAAAPDILREIDLLNGADTYDVWNLVSLPD